MDAIVLGLFDDPEAARALPARAVGFAFRRLAADEGPHGRLPGPTEDARPCRAWASAPMPHPQTETHGQFVGSDKCESCHEESYAIWKKTPHCSRPASRSSRPIRRGTSIPSASVATWSAGIRRKFFPYQSGYLSQEKTPNMTNVGCEDCHGPGEKHVAAEMGATRPCKSNCAKRSASPRPRPPTPTRHKQQLLLVPRPGQQPRVRLQDLLAVRGAHREGEGAAGQVTTTSGPPALTSRMHGSPHGCHGLALWCLAFAATRRSCRLFLFIGGKKA